MTSINIDADRSLARQRMADTEDGWYILEMADGHHAIGYLTNSDDDFMSGEPVPDNWEGTAAMDWVAGGLYDDPARLDYDEGGAYYYYDYSTFGGWCLDNYRMLPIIRLPDIDMQELDINEEEQHATIIDCAYRSLFGRLMA